MADQTTLDLAYADRHAGQDANLAAGHTVLGDERARIETALAQLARTGQPFTADHVHQLLGDGDDYDRNRVSSLIGNWAQHRRIFRVAERGLTPSAHRTRKGSRNSWWTGPTVPTQQKGTDQ